MLVSHDVVTAEESPATLADDGKAIIYLDPNGGVGEVLTVDIGYVGVATYPLDPHIQKPTREGYTFMGWADNPDNPTTILYGGLSAPDECSGQTFYAIWARGSGTPEEPIWGEVKASFAAVAGKYFASGTEIQMYNSRSSFPDIDMEVNGESITEANDGVKLTLVLTEGTNDVLLTNFSGLTQGTETDIEDYIEFGNRSVQFQCFAVDYTPPYETLEFLSDPGDGTLTYVGRGGDDADSNR